jgi:hypothetical protein
MMTITAQRQGANGQFVTEFEEFALDIDTYIYFGDRFKAYEVGDELTFECEYGKTYYKYGPRRKIQFIYNPRKIKLIDYSGVKDHDNY